VLLETLIEVLVMFDVGFRSELDALGLLSQSILPKEYDWLDNCDKQLLLSLYLYKDSGGMHKSEVKKWVKSTYKYRVAHAKDNQLDEPSEDCLLLLEARQLVVWEKDTQGNDMYLTLTWRGEDIAMLLLAVAKHENNRHVST
jgi:hypothetical protein